MKATNKFRADLHCHSTCSDGSLTPEELVSLAGKIELQGLSITDHDTVSAYPQVQHVGTKLGIKILPGVEFSAQLNGRGVHILGYAFDVEHPTITTLCKRHKERRLLRNSAILQKLTDNGLKITETDLPKSLGALGRPHIAEAMIRKGYVSSIQAAFTRWIGDGAPCFASGEGVPVQETIQAIRSAGGVAILAHPHLIKDSQLKKRLLDMDFDGLEGYYAYFPKEVDEHWCKIAKERNWMITGGSDFHGDCKPKITLGRSWINQELFDTLWKRHRQATANP